MKRSLFLNGLEIGYLINRLIVFGDFAMQSFNKKHELKEISNIFTGRTNSDGSYDVIYTCTIQFGNKTFPVSGCGNTIEQARLNCQIYANHIVNSKEFNIDSNQYNISNSIINNHQKESKDRFAGGGDKPISENQINFITSLANRIGESADKISIDYYNKTLEELQGSQANRIIRELKRMGR